MGGVGWGQSGPSARAVRGSADGKHSLGSDHPGRARQFPRNPAEQDTPLSAGPLPESRSPPSAPTPPQPPAHLQLQVGVWQRDGRHGQRLAPDVGRAAQQLHQRGRKLRGEHQVLLGVLLLVLVLIVAALVFTVVAAAAAAPSLLLLIVLAAPLARGRWLLTLAPQGCCRRCCPGSQLLCKGRGQAGGRAGSVGRRAWGWLTVPSTSHEGRAGCRARLGPGFRTSTATNNMAVCFAASNNGDRPAARSPSPSSSLPLSEPVPSSSLDPPSSSSPPPIMWLPRSLRRQLTRRTQAGGAPVAPPPPPCPCPPSSSSSEEPWPWCSSWQPEPQAGPCTCPSCPSCPCPCSCS